MEVQELVSQIRQHIPDAQVFARDLTGGGDHFEAFVVSNLFIGKTRLEKERLVMRSLGPLMEKIHAFTLKTFTVSEWPSTG